MRIISGKYRGMKLAEIKCDGIRPTADRVKESLFNILGQSLAGTRVLDLFCGSGNLGIESLSRGAQFVHFNDCSRESIAVLNANLKKLKDENYAVTTLDFKQCLSVVRGKFDYVFIDPPYSSDAGVQALTLIGETELLGGVAVYERDRAFSGEAKGLELFDERRYGKTYLSFFRPLPR